jgi:hypothetical protein
VLVPSGGVHTDQVGPGCWKASDETDNYNCLAFALGIEDESWWPGRSGFFWPRIPLLAEVEEISEIIAEHGYEPCQSGLFEYGYEKIALFVRSGQAEHAARQLPHSGIWVSKLGDAGMDVRQRQLLDYPTMQQYAHCLTIYGAPTYFFRRKNEYVWQLRTRLAHVLRRILAQIP